MSSVYNLGEDRNGRVNTVDYESLTLAQEEKLREFKISTRIENEKYLRAHPEVDDLIADFLSNVLLERPIDVREFAAIHFNKLAASLAPKKEEDNEENDGDDIKKDTE